ncbi:MAG: IS66 family insertion sequence element accessory protein TnpA [Gammaproteobacteria bacterium]
MSKPERRDPEKEKFWRNTISEYRSSGLGQTEFCRQRGLNVNSLNAWVRILKTRDKEQMSKRRQKVNEKNGESYWSAMLSDWQESGLTLRQFAIGRKVNYKSMCRWKNTLLPCLAQNPVSQHHSSAGKPSDSFVPVRVVDTGEEPTIQSNEQAVRRAGVLEVILRCGRIIRVSPDCRLEFLSAVVSVIERC